MEDNRFCDWPGCADAATQRLAGAEGREYLACDEHAAEIRKNDPDFSMSRQERRRAQKTKRPKGRRPQE